MGEILHVDFSGEGRNPEAISGERLEEIRTMAENFVAINRMVKAGELKIDEDVFNAIKAAYPLSMAESMQVDLLNSSEADWRGRPEYFFWVADSFLLSDPSEMRRFSEFRQAADEQKEIAG